VTNTLSWDNAKNVKNFRSVKACKTACSKKGKKKTLLKWVAGSHADKILWWGMIDLKVAQQGRVRTRKYEREKRKKKSPEPIPGNKKCKRSSREKEKFVTMSGGLVKRGECTGGLEKGATRKKQTY